MTNTSVKALEAAARFLEHRGYEVLDRKWVCDSGTVDLVVTDGEAFVFTQVRANLGERPRAFPPECTDAGHRESREAVMLAYMASHPDITDSIVRFDDISIVLTARDHAVIRHHISSLSEDACEKVA